ncbi:bifunctional DNA-binding transcriptional regulator/O6-methylguanine-DNA methyltransferase Ada [Caballeronia sp. EK]|uniref:Methylated-DNA--protein-cysteine methyltransferase n=1 Tax=Caballeronia novacaledonica TaxID=1544861 RepID=A0AA37MMI2_9BURK|nr:MULTISPECIES: bifunctional DNA-binding transcriptional regulator/O6-methylguanine-DNA methyltransferase Ada [Caballeronia]MBC8641118.1 bifunctional DNA-binding transcriptional regulator/O6-methylguanine-DNA methyltransferase Ada [Caballeronia sp. EK]GJH22966.1 bifunctional DNA-binding transcriptional regulator/O6-methylguanine-DNA methyltransferase Ada [Caballeronia novacaledonica]
MKTVSDSFFSSDECRWQAVVERDERADGAFFFAVRTTGVFCRPSCASRAPRRENVEFFPTTDAAEAAGYRACKRCQPTSLPRELAIVERACKVLDADPQQRVTLAQLSDAVHVSPFHLQRLFSRIVGISPRQYQAAQRAGVLRDALQRGRDVTRATHDAGFGSPSRMYEAVPTELGMTPSAYKRKGAGLTVRYATATTPLGTVLVAATDKGVCKIAFGDDANTLAEQLAADFAQAERVEDAAKMEPFIAQIRAYLQGTRERFDLPLDIGATAFQRRVWDALRSIPYGQTRSYSDIAESLGSPRAVRAVANACGSNPVALAIPCHRVIGKDGAISGYRWGKPRKEALLETERTRNETNKVA